MKYWMSGLLLVAATIPARGQPQSAPADEYPSHTIRIMVATPAGGGVDAITRVVAEKLRQRWGQNVVVENRTGAGGTTAAEMLSRAAPDGYTLYTTHPGPLAAAAIYKKLGYDPLALQPIAIMAVAPMVIAAKKASPLNSVSELVKYAKANPGKLNFATSGAGTISHLTTELLKQRTGVHINIVPYRGSAPAVNDLAGGQVDGMAVDVGTVMPIVESGRAKVIGAATPERLPMLPQTPTVTEQGLPDFVTTTWYALVAPPGTPRSIADKLNAAVLEALQSREAAPQMKALMIKPLPIGVEQTQQFIQSEAKRWTRLIKDAGISLE
jgi:tripartite-type tricarboxylate transporter receptor subunit TctC